MSSTPSKRSIKRAVLASESRRPSTAGWQLKITLYGAKPPIWRRVQVPAAMPLSDLHHVIQTAMGWTDSRLHQFEIGGDTYAAPNEFYDPDPDQLDARAVRLGDVVQVGETLTYTYDFGDDWRHDVLVGEEVEVAPDVELPVCVGGRRGCPPEDVGVSGATPTSCGPGRTRTTPSTRSGATGRASTSTRSLSIPTR